VEYARTGVENAAVSAVPLDGANVDTMTEERDS